MVLESQWAWGRAIFCHSQVRWFFYQKRKDDHKLPIYRRVQDPFKTSTLYGRSTDAWQRSYSGDCMPPPNNSQRMGQLTIYITKQHVLFQYNHIKTYMFIVNWFKGILQKLGLAAKSGKIIFLGLDNAGKTTLLGILKDNKIKQYDPTLQPHSEELTLGNLKFKTWDLGGHLAARKAWKNYFPNVNGIVYMVDASAPERFKDSSLELQNLLMSPAIQHVPICILGNKIDKKSAVSEQEMREGLRLPSKFMQKSDRPLQVFMCSITKRSGYAEAFKWLGQFLT